MALLDILCPFGDVLSSLQGFSVISSGIRQEKVKDLCSSVILYLTIAANWSCQDADNLYSSMPFKKELHKLNISKRDD